ncbi:MAG TPA: MBG domain-containing protein [Chloroflexia bacterium]|nr:MBG domain-containing protein [Chloroflexia bacterium]
MISLAVDDRTYLCQVLQNDFDIEELIEIAMKLGLETTDFDTSVKRPFCRELTEAAERHGLLGCLLAEIEKRRQEVDIPRMLSQAPPCEPSAKLEVVVRGLDFSLSQLLVFKQTLAHRLGLQVEQVRVLGVAPGILAVLICLPRKAAVQIAENQEQFLALGPFKIETLHPFETLNPTIQHWWNQQIEQSWQNLLDLAPAAAQGAGDGGGRLLNAEYQPIEITRVDQELERRPVVAVGYGGHNGGGPPQNNQPFWSRPIGWITLIISLLLLAGAIALIALAIFNNQNNQPTPTAIPPTFTAAPATTASPVPQIKLDNLHVTYDGKPRPVTVSVTPENLRVIVTYDGSSTPPTQAGSYQVKAEVQNSREEASVNATLVIDKASASLVLTGLEQAYTGQGLSIKVATNPGGLPYQVTYNGVSDLPVNVGSYTVKAQIQDNNYAGESSATLIIRQATPTITLKNLTQAYDGKPKEVAVVTDPTGLPFKILYNDSTQPPTNVGSYQVTVSVDTPNYKGSVRDTLSITKAGPTIEITGLNPVYDAKPKQVGVKITPADLPYTVTYNGSTDLPVNAGNYLVEVKVQNDQYQGTQQASMTIQKAPVTITFYNDTPVYNKQPHAIRYRYTTAPQPASPLKIDVTYDGSADVPVNAGTYRTAATVQEINYTGSAQTDYKISKGTATVTLNLPSNLVYDGTAKVATATASFMDTAVPGDKIGITYNGTADAPANAGSYQVVATVNDSNITGSDSKLMIIEKRRVVFEIGVTVTPNTTQPRVTYAVTVAVVTKNFAPPNNVINNFRYNLYFAGVDNQYRGSQPPTQEGTYVVTVTPTDTANYDGIGSKQIIVGPIVT